MEKFCWENYIRMGGGDANLRINKKENWFPVYVSEDLADVSLSKKQGWSAVFPITDSGQERTWNTCKNTFAENIKENNVKAVRENGRLRILRKLRARQIIKTHWDSPKYNATRYGTQSLSELIGENPFPYPKSLYTVLDTLKIMTNKNDIVLDFFAGSGTTAHAVLALNKEDGGNRKFILVEQLEEHADICRKRTQKVLVADDSKESFVCCELAPYNESFMKKIQAAKSSESLLEIWREMAENSFLNWYVNHSIPAEAEGDFVAVGKEQGLDAQKRLLCCLLDKNQLYVNLSEMDDSRYNIGEADKRLNRLFQEDSDA